MTTPATQAAAITTPSGEKVPRRRRRPGRATLGTPMLGGRGAGA